MVSVVVEELVVEPAVDLLVALVHYVGVVALEQFVLVVVVVD